MLVRIVLEKASIAMEKFGESGARLFHEEDNPKLKTFSCGMASLLEHALVDGDLRSE